MFFIIISALHVSGGFCPSSGAYKTVCAALGIVTLSSCLPLVWFRWNIQFYKLLMMGGKTTRNM
jgi:hypothetical protein